MGLVFGIVTDLHFGPEARFDGKLRKLTHEAAALTREVARRMNDDVRPAMMVNLGDDIEDESAEADAVRYGECQSILRTIRAPLVNVAGNHDTIHINREELLRFWNRTGSLYYSFDEGAFHFAVLHTAERKDVDVRIAKTQLDWLKTDLAATKKPTIVLMHHSASEQDLTDSRWFYGKPELALVKEREDLRSILEASGKVRAVFNGHVHRNHIDVIQGIPYVTVQSLIENLDEDAPGRAAGAFAVVQLTEQRMIVRVHGNDPARYQVEFPR